MAHKLRKSFNFELLELSGNTTQQCIVESVCYSYFLSFFFWHLRSSPMAYKLRKSFDFELLELSGNIAQLAVYIWKCLLLIFLKLQRELIFLYKVFSRS